MLNFRKLKQDFPSAIVKEGKELFDLQKVLSAKLLHLDSKTLRISGRILGQYDNQYESEMEIDRQECEAIDSNCDCPYNYDCQHLAALLFYLEEHLDKILVTYSKENDVKQLAKEEDLDESEQEEFLKKFKEAETKEVQRQEEQYQKQVLQEYITAADLLATSPFFRPIEKKEFDKAECALIFHRLAEKEGDASKAGVEIQVALRLPLRSKPLHIPHIKQFFECLRYEEPLFIGNKKYCFSLYSFDASQREIMRMMMDHVRYLETQGTERAQRMGWMSTEVLGMVLARSFEMASAQCSTAGFSRQEEEMPILSGLYEGSLETPLRFSLQPAVVRFFLEYISPPASKILLNPMIVVGDEVISLEETTLFECAKPGMLYGNVYYSFPSHISRLHLRNLRTVREMTIPEPLFGTFVENALPDLTRCAEVANQYVIEDFTTLPFVGAVSARCDLSFLNGELEASIHFNYEGNEIPEASTHLTYMHASSFVTSKGILARNLVEEKKIIEDLFSDFLYNPEAGIYVAKSEKKIVEFMTDVVPRNQHRVTFHYPQNLLDLFIYDQTTFKLHLTHTDKVDCYEIQLKVNGALKGIKLDLLWECMASRKAFIELDTPKAKAKKGADAKMSKILVLDLERLSGVIQLFDEIGIALIDDHTIQRPLWSIANIEASHFKDLPVEFSISEKLLDIRQQMLGEKTPSFSPVPSAIQATLRSYQLEGVHWLERLRMMHLSGILADDMGLGKTLQAIVAIAQHRQKKAGCSLIVCPTSLLYNWKEEFHKFYPDVKVGVVDGVPLARKKQLEVAPAFDVLITSYTLLQKDIDMYKEIPLTYVILDEAQHIKNRGTRNAKSVKQIRAHHRLILSGTPIENSLDELWSLFDFLMPGFLSTYDRFVEKYVRLVSAEQSKNLQFLRKKIAPFILRRMKADVLEDLPPVSEIVYHCQLNEMQQELYRSYAESARNELVKLVKKEGFDRVQIHVLATLTRLKQICCHPAIFAKEKAESGDSSKYEMLLDLLQTLVEGKHKTVIFSQYTRMLQIMREDFQQRGIRFTYLDGSSKNRLETVKEFNENEHISVFLVSLKAGGTGLNLVGADTVIHYDMWWNPAVENQATDRVHRIGQKRSVSSYKLITLGTIEEKIAEMQKSKKGLVKKVVSCDDEAIAKLTWEDVLELLKT